MSVVVAENLGKRYKHYPRPGQRLWEWLSGGHIVRHVPVWVVRGVSFRVEPGEAVAVVGANGAGKSTLLRIVAGTLAPSEGSLRLRGRVAALELGLGFHPDLTGRENALTAGQLLGHSRAELEQLLPEIEAFAELGDVLDNPVRTYSSGMQLRLGFSVATARRPDILIVDEVLAVGDAYFKQKCIARIRRFRAEGTTLLFVSHDAAAVKLLCDRALLLDEGLLVREGGTTEVLDYYNAMIARMTEQYEILQGEALRGTGGTTRSGDGRVATERVELCGDAGPTQSFRVGSRLRIRVHGRCEEDVEDLTVGISIRDRLGYEVFGTNSHHLGVPARRMAPGEHFLAEFSLPVNLGVGHYSVTVALHLGSAHVEGSYDWWDQVTTFQVIPGSEPRFVGCAHLPTELSLEIGEKDATPRDAAAGDER